MGAVDSLGIESSIQGAQGFGPLIRPGLGASQLNGIAARLAAQLVSVHFSA